MSKVQFKTKQVSKTENEIVFYGIFFINLS